MQLARTRIYIDGALKKTGSSKQSKKLIGTSSINSQWFIFSAHLGEDIRKASTLTQHRKTRRQGSELTSNLETISGPMA